MGAQILNELTGEAAITDKAGRKYHVVFDLDAVIAVEKMTGRSAMELMMSRPGITDCIVMIIAGTGGWARRNPGAGGPRVNENLAKRIFADGGGIRLGPILAESLSCAEGLGLEAAADEHDGGEDGPLLSPPL